MLSEKRKLLAGDAVGHYRIISLLGKGGMGQVYLADDTKLHRKVSLKFLPSEFTQDPERLRRFEQEARAVSALNHPNTLTIHEIGETNGHRFIVTEFIDGQSLRERLRSPLEIDEALEIAIQVASALVAAHRVNIIHRDIKPDNIMIRNDDGLVKLLDFGLAKISSAAPFDPEANTQLRNTSPGVVMGTVAYMSPEQARGEIVDERSDIWSLGVVIYEMIAGCSPFMAGSSNEIISAILSKQPSPGLARHWEIVPERLEEIVAKALTKNRDERYQTCKDLLIDLKRLKQSLQLKASLERSTASNKTGDSARTKGAHSASSAEYVVSRVKGHKLGILFALITLVILLSGLAAYRWRQPQIANVSPAITSIAVLPFSNTSSDPNTDFLSDGITDNIIERLSQVPGLRVTSHSAVFHYKGHDTDPRTIGTELNVEAILTGRVVQRGDDLTIRMELVNAKDNSHIWGGSYDRKMKDLLSVQREIPVDVSNQLQLRLSGDSKDRLARSHTENQEAYQLYLKGRYSWEQWTEEGAKQAADYFEEAIKKDPNYALAYAGLADAYVFGSYAGAWVPQNEAHRRGREAAIKALTLDPQLGEAHVALGSVLIYNDWDFAGAEKEFKQGLALNPSFAQGHHEYSHLLSLLGRFDESLSESKKFLELDPVSEDPIGHLAYHYRAARQYDEAIEQYQKVFKLFPKTRDAQWCFQLGDVYGQKEMFPEAVAEYLKGFERAGWTSDRIEDLRQAFARAGITGFYRKLLEQLKSDPDERLDLIGIAELYARLGEKDQSFEWLERAYSKRSDGLVHLRENLGFDNVRSDPRYADLLHRIGLPV
jgi:serine/threonine protein kinase/Tfp pilus assembly protein PilF